MFKTKKQLLDDRINMLKIFKKELKKENIKNPQKKKNNFNIFKFNCRNRQYDSLAGYVKIKNEDQYYWYNEGK